MSRRRMSAASESAPSAAPTAFGVNAADFVTSSPDTAEQALSSVLAAQISASNDSHQGRHASSSVQSSPSSLRRLSRLSVLHQRSSSFQESDPVAAEPVVSQISVEAEGPSDVHSSASLGRRGTSSARRRAELPELERMSVARLRHQSSSATIKSINASNEGDDGQDTTSSSSIHAPPSLRRDPSEHTTGGTGPGALRQERRKRSALLEQDVSRMRSESRLGRVSRSSMTASTSPDAERSGGIASRSSIHTPQSQFEDVGDESSGTEGSGPVVGNRRRKKSSTSSASKRAAARAAQWSRPPELPHVSAATNGNEEANVRRSGRRGSDGSRLYPGTVGRTPTGASTRRMNVPEAFRTDISSSGGSSSNSRRNTITADDKHAWPASSKDGDTDQSIGRNALRNGYRPRRFASDAEAPSPSLGDSTSSSRRIRVNVDASGISRHLDGDGGLGTRRGVPSGERSVVGEDGAMDEALLLSPSEIARQRKISTSSSISHRSSGAASEVHRSASRASLRRSMGGGVHGGRDVFDDATPPPLPDHSAAFDRSRLANPMVMDKPLSRTQLGRGSTIEELRARLDELTNPQSLSVNALHNPSRSSSRASRARSNVSSTPSTSQTTTSSTSMRQSIGESRRSATLGHDRSMSEASPELKHGAFGGGTSGTLRRAQAPSRLAEYNVDAVSAANTVAGQPRTPFSHASSLHSRRSVSRLTNVPSSFASRTPSRFSHSSGPALESVPHAEQSVPTTLHARNLLNSIESLERQLLGLNNAGQASMEAEQLASRMREASESAIDINASLRSVLHSVLTFQIDAEVGRLDESGSQNAFAMLDRDLGVLLRQSDEQVRSLTDGLMALTHWQEASPIAVQHSSPLSHTQAQPYGTPVMSMSTDSPPLRERPSSRIGLGRGNPATRSPQHERVAAAGSQRRSSLDLRRARTLIASSSTQTSDVGSRTIS